MAHKNPEKQPTVQADEEDYRRRAGQDPDGDVGLDKLLPWLAKRGRSLSCCKGGSGGITWVLC